MKILLFHKNALPRFEGCIDLVRRQGQELSIHGWVWKPADPEEKVCADIVLGGNVVTTVTADKFREDLLKAGIGKGYHAFVSGPVNGTLTDEETRALGIRPKGVSQAIQQRDYLIETVPASGFEGSIDEVELYGPVARISGWIWQPQEPNEPVNTDIVLNNQTIATTLANVMRDDLKAAGKGNGRHGFSVIAMRHLSPAQARELRLLPPGESNPCAQHSEYAVMYMPVDDKDIFNVLLKASDACLEKGDADGALIYLKKLLIMDPDNPKINKHLRKILMDNQYSITKKGDNPVPDDPLTVYRQELHMFHLFLDEMDTELNALKLDS